MSSEPKELIAELCVSTMKVKVSTMSMGFWNWVLIAGNGVLVAKSDNCWMTIDEARTAARRIAKSFPFIWTIRIPTASAFVLGKQRGIKKQ